MPIQSIIGKKLTWLIGRIDDLGIIILVDFTTEVRNNIRAADLDKSMINMTIAGKFTKCEGSLFKIEIEMSSEAKLSDVKLSRKWKCVVSFFGDSHFFILHSTKIQRYTGRLNRVASFLLVSGVKVINDLKFRFCQGFT
jgi:hypothetical protein